MPRLFWISSKHCWALTVSVVYSGCRYVYHPCTVSGSGSWCGLSVTSTSPNASRGMCCSLFMLYVRHTLPAWAAPSGDADLVR